MKKIIICLFLSVGLSGCHIYRAYERPDEVVADSLYRQSVAAEDTVSLASLSALCLPYSTRDNEQCGWYKNFQNL